MDSLGHHFTADFNNQLNIDCFAPGGCGNHRSYAHKVLSGTEIDSSTISTPANFGEPATLQEVLCWRALHQSTEPIFTFLTDGEDDEQHITFAALDLRARAVAATLRRHVEPGTRALLVYEPSLEYIVALFGCLYAGVVAVPAYPPDPFRMRRTWPRLQAIYRDAQASLVLAESEYLSRAESWLASLSSRKPVMLATDEVSDDRQEMWEPHERDRDDAAILQYTSGTTGDPKGVVISHGNLIHNLSRMCRLEGNCPPRDAVALHRLAASRGGRTAVSWLPPYHDMGLIAGVLLPVYTGRHTIVMSPLKFIARPVRWLQAISRYRASTSGGPSFAYELCANKISEAERSTLDLSNWTTAIIGAELVRANVMDQFVEEFGACGFRREAFFPCYGLAEATLLVAAGRQSAAPTVDIFQATALQRRCALPAAPNDPTGIRLVGCGRSLSKHDLRVVDPESLTRCRDGEVGEIWVRGPSLSRGYWNRAAESEETFHAQLADAGIGPFVRTGDLGFIFRSELYVTGRIHDAIVIDGRHHQPEIIETTIERCHKSFKTGQCAVFSLDIDGQTGLVVVQELARPKKHNLGAIQRLIRRSVADTHGIQVHSVLLVRTGSLPKTSSGKIQRSACRVSFLNGGLDVVKDSAERQGEYGRPANEEVLTSGMFSRSATVQLCGHMYSRSARDTSHPAVPPSNRRLAKKTAGQLPGVLGTSRRMAPCCS